MPRSHFMRVVARLSLLLVTIALPRLASATWPHDPNENLPVSLSEGTAPVAVSDGAGGMICVWLDAASSHLKANHVSASGTLTWGSGVLVCTATGVESAAQVISDGAGGVVVTWSDDRNGNKDVYAQRLDRSGGRVWPDTGVVICKTSGDQYNVSICAGGSGSAIIAWQDYRNGATTSYDVYVRKVLANGTVQWTSNGVALCTATGNQAGVVCCSDGSGGAIVAWHDYRGTTDADVYARRVNSSGTPQWTANGVCLHNSVLTGYQTWPRIAADGDGGAIVAWQDSRAGTYDIYAQRLDSSGLTYWSGGALEICTATADQLSPEVVSDGVGGIFVAWDDYRSGSSYDVYGQHLQSDGTFLWTSTGKGIATGSTDQMTDGLCDDGEGGVIVVWNTELPGYPGHSDLYAQRITSTGSSLWGSGTALSTAPYSQKYGVPVEDGNGGALVVFPDYRSVIWKIYAQNVDRYGELGDAAPTITSVKDVAYDQGGQVLVQWTPSYLDASPSYPIVNYSVWRQVPTAVAQARMASGASVGRRPIRTSVAGGQTTYWEYLLSTPARGLAGYSAVVPTTADSVAGSNPLTSFMVMAEESSPPPDWSSAAVSGYSVDNLAPPVPAPFTGQYADGVCALNWGESAAPDVAGYRLYRGHDASFVPGAENLVTSQTGTGYADHAGGPYWYKLCAVDVHGNTSGYALLLPSGTTGAPNASLPRDVWLSRAAPNPAHNGCALRFGLPRDGAVTLAIYDQQGRRLRVLVSGERAAGEHLARWDGRNDAGQRVASGLYFAQLESDGRRIVQRVVTVR